MKQCKCGSMAFNLRQEGIDQGELCDRHYWQDRAEQAEKDAARYRYLQEHARFEWRNGPGLYWYLPRGGDGDPGDRLSASIDGSIAAIAKDAP